MIDVDRIRELGAVIERATLELCDLLSPDAAQNILKAQTVFATVIADGIKLTTGDESTIEHCRYDSGMTEGGKRLLCGLHKGHATDASPNEGGHAYTVSVPLDDGGGKVIEESQIG